MVYYFRHIKIQNCYYVISDTESGVIYIREYQLNHPVVGYFSMNNGISILIPTEYYIDTIISFVTKIKLLSQKMQHVSVLNLHISEINLEDINLENYLKNLKN